MGRLKKKSVKRALDFYLVSCKFRRPFMVLLDGNFIHTALGFRIEDLQDRIAKLFSAGKGVKLCTTSCVFHELKGLGADFQETYDWAVGKALLTDCPHRECPSPPDECLRSLVGADNSKHYIIATQDSGLREALSEVQGGASIFISVNGLHLTQPSQKQLELAGLVTKRSMLPSDQERQSVAFASLQQRKADRRDPNHTHKSSRRKKKKAKGPNPLSVKKPKRKEMNSRQGTDKKGKKPGRQKANA